MLELSFCVIQVDWLFPCAPLTVRPDAVVFVAAQHDQYIPSAGAIQSKWAQLEARWPGARVQWMRGGHVSAILFPRVSHAHTVAGVIMKLLR